MPLIMAFGVTEENQLAVIDKNAPDWGGGFWLDAGWYEGSVSGG